ncbi:MAG TPA: PEGA domain-containing protein [Longimicrobium sp.]|nr:PEGA domain-containing protein [Longimicrobium sp.]
MRRVRLVVPAAVLGLSLALSGCATLFASGTETVSINSEPEGARVRTQSGQTLGVTPFTTQLDPSRRYTLTFEREGYENTVFELGRKVDGIAFLNLLCLLCWGIDFATGAMWGLEENEINVTLQRRTAMLEERKTEIACHNYRALTATELAGQIAADVRAAGDAVVLQATGVSREQCAVAH